MPGLHLQYITVGPASTIKPPVGLVLVQLTHWSPKCGLFFNVSPEAVVLSEAKILTRPRGDPPAGARSCS